MRDSKIIAGEINVLDERIENLRGKRDALKKEFNAAAIAEATERHKDIVGKRASRKVPGGFRRDERGQKGVITVYDPDKHRGLRQLYRMEPGDLFVMSDGGQTGYTYYTAEEIAKMSRMFSTNERPWEIE